MVDSRQVESATVVKRRRECLACHKRFTTYERYEIMPLMVIKKDGRREVYDAAKLRSGVIKSCEKRPISLAQIDQLVDTITQIAQNSMEDELSSDYIGELVMNELRTLDPVAYVRFASVYRQFTDIDTFRRELDKLLK